VNPAPWANDAGPRPLIRVALLDDHPVVITGLQRLLASANDIDVVASAGDPASLARGLNGRRADVVIMDYDPARSNALAVCRRVKSRETPPRVLFYTAYVSPALAIAARAAQADGLVDKSEPAAVLLDALRRVADGATVIPTVDRDAFEAGVARLDDSDLPVFAMLLDGATVTGIAAALRSDERDAVRRAHRVVERLRPRLRGDGHYGSTSPRRIA
jgi:DNA-binding NarL/FixJ family response regulator